MSRGERGSEQGKYHHRRQERDTGGTRVVKARRQMEWHATFLKRKGTPLADGQSVDENM